MGSHCYKKDFLYTNNKFFNNNHAISENILEIDDFPLDILHFEM